jgi:hypothetical protein
MKRREFVVTLGGVPLLAVAGSRLFAGSPKGGALVDTPQKRMAYTQKLLRELCTDIGPHPTGTPAFARAAQIIRKEMERSLPVVEYDKFTLEKWELLGEPEFDLGGQPIETYPAFGGEGTPPEGVSGILQPDRRGYALVDPATGERRAQITVSTYGRAITHYQKHTTPPSLPSFGIGKQDVPLIENAVRDKTPARLKAVVRFVPDATGCNIIGRLPGKTSDEILIVAHADTVYCAPGANDNTASAIVMLMLAHAAAAEPASDFTLTFVATDAEEFGMLGAQHYGGKRAADGTMKNIRLVANFDSLTYGPNLWISSKDQGLKDMIQAIHRDLNIKTTPKYDDGDGFVMDSEPFRPSGGTAFHANSRGYDEKTLPIYHRPDDTAANVPLDCVEIGFEVFHELLKRWGRTTPKS